MSKHVLTFLVGIFLWVVPFQVMAQSIEHDNTAAVIFAYHRIGEDQFPDTNVRREQFAAHIKELTSGAYNVMALPDVIRAFKNDTKLPDRTIVLTFDGAHKSILDVAVPLLEDNDLPFTLFLPTNHVDRDTNEYMSWSDIKDLARNDLATIGLHPASYIRLHTKTKEEITRQINNARARFRDELDKEPEFFAYPFGEYSKAYRDIIEQQGFVSAFGQQSGVAHKDGDLFTLSRFPMTESYSGLDRFRLTANALPLPVTEIEPKDPMLKTANPNIGLSIDEGLGKQLDKISCFVSGQDKPEMEIVGSNRIELRLIEPFEAERARINCTLPIPAGENYEEPRWRWFGMQLIVPKNIRHSWESNSEESTDN